MAIDWVETEKQFGYTSSLDLKGKRPKVICKCDNCEKRETITVRVKSKVINNDMTWKCYSCIGKERSSEISAQLLKQWEDTNYAANITNNSLKLWKDIDYRKRHSAAVKKAMLNVDMSHYLRERYKDPAEKAKVKASAIELWKNEAFRLKHKLIMNSDEIRSAISKEARARWKTIAYREKMADIRSNQQQNISGIQQMLYTLLDDLNIDYHKEGPLTKIGYYCFDCLIPTNNLLIECQGDYWHSLKVAQMRDKQKFTYITKYFPQYKIAYFWEREFYQDNRVISRLRSLLGLPQPHVDFDFKDVRVQKVEETKHFLDLYHYLGPGRGGIKYGAFLGDNLIAVALFSKPLRQNILQQFDEKALECSRFCIHPSYQKKNFASWFLSKTTQAIPNTIYSYADTTVGHIGTIYKAAGWEHHHTVPPDYWYMDKDGYIMHKKTLYNRAQNLRLTESEFAERFEYQKIVGGPKECYVLKRTGAKHVD